MMGDVIAQVEHAAYGLDQRAHAFGLSPVPRRAVRVMDDDIGQDARLFPLGQPVEEVRPEAE